MANWDDETMIDIMDDFKELSVEETRKMAEEFDAKLNQKLEDWFYNLPSIKRCTITKELLEEINKRGKDEQF